ncbi:hypothetical protein TSMEX_006749, partial [Taenia solium]
CLFGSIGQLWESSLQASSPTTRISVLHVRLSRFTMAVLWMWKWRFGASRQGNKLILQLPTRSSLKVGVIFTEEDRADFCLIFLLMIWFFRVDFPNLY